MMRTKTTVFFMLVHAAFAAGLLGQASPFPAAPPLVPEPPPVPNLAAPPIIKPAPPPESGRSSQAETVERAGRDLKNPKEEVRLGAAKLLGKYKTPRSVTFLAASLDDASVRVRRAVVISFSEFLMDGIFVGDRSFMEKFLSKLGDPDVEVRRQVSQMLPRLSYGLFRSSLQIVEIGGRKVYRSTSYRLPAALAMIAQRAFLDEVQRLHDAGSFGVQSREALGYKQLLEHLKGGCSHEEAVEQIKILSRRFAKQQRTWLRRFQYLWEGYWIEAAEKDTETIANEALAFINSSPATPPS